LVQTVDFFPPVVDSPFRFGQIAAANALSDVYAMGGKPLTALNIVAYPVDDLAPEILLEILEGGADKAREAGVTIVGGHTVDDAEPKYGMAVTGTVHPGKILRNKGARPGDRLVLTKPIGTGILTTACKRDRIPAAALEEATLWMATLNRAASEAMVEVGVRACTDITGFGLAGHLHEMVHGGEVGALLRFESLPLLDSVLELAKAGVVPGGTKRNLEYLAPHLKVMPGLNEPEQWILADSQTSGGLLAAVEPTKVQYLLETLQKHGAQGWEIGEVTAEPGISVTL
jgi:selenide,water dikinase